MSETSKQPTLVKIPGPEQEAILVMGRMMRAAYVRPHFDRSKKGDRFVSLEVSQPVTTAHLNVLPNLIMEAWADVAKKNRTRLDLDGIPPQYAKFYLTPDASDSSLFVEAAKMTHVSLRLIEESGSGKAQKVIRLSYRLKAKLNQDLAYFAEWNFGEQYWLELGTAGGKTFDFGDDEEADAKEA